MTPFIRPQLLAQALMQRPQGMAGPQLPQMIGGPPGPGPTIQPLSERQQLINDAIKSLGVEDYRPQFEMMYNSQGIGSDVVPPPRRAYPPLR